MPELTRRSLAVGCLGAAATVLGGCGVRTADGGGTASPNPSGSSSPTAGTDGTLEALRLFVAGGFTTAASAFRTVPELTLTPDDRVLTAAPVPEIYPGPLLLHLDQRSIDEAGRRALAEAVRASGLLDGPAPDFGTPGVADAPTTTLRVTLAGTTTTWAANALTEAPAGDPRLTEGQRAARTALQGLVGRLRDLEGTVGAGHLGELEPYVPDGVWLRTLPFPEERVTEDPEPVVLPWPVAEVDLADLTTPTLVEGEAADAVLATLEGAGELTRYRVPGSRPRDPVYEVLARPAIPGDPDDGTL
jgi:hypothetical protein